MAALARTRLASADPAACQVFGCDQRRYKKERTGLWGPACAGYGRVVEFWNVDMGEIGLL